MKKLAFALVLLVGLLSFDGGQSAPTDPGDYLLQAVKTVAYSGRLDDPDIVGSLLNMPMVRNYHFQNLWHDVCPAGGYLFSDRYAVAGNNWFHALPTGMKNMRSLPSFFGDIGAPPYDVIGSPNIEYQISPTDNCVGPGYGLILSELDFKNIPSYAFISEEQIKFYFPKLISDHGDLPMNGSWLSYLVAGQYSSVPGHPSSVDTTKPFTIVSFVMTQEQWGDTSHQPVCLHELYMRAGYQFGGLHDLPGQVPYPEAETHPLSPGQ